MPRIESNFNFSFGAIFRTVILWLTGWGLLDHFNQTAFVPWVQWIGIIYCTYIGVILVLLVLAVFYKDYP